MEQIISKKYSKNVDVTDEQKMKVFKDDLHKMRKISRKKSKRMGGEYFNLKYSALLQMIRSKKNFDKTLQRINQRNTNTIRVYSENRSIGNKNPFSDKNSEKIFSDATLEVRQSYLNQEVFCITKILDEESENEEEIVKIREEDSDPEYIPPPYEVPEEDNYLEVIGETSNRTEVSFNQSDFEDLPEEMNPELLRDCPDTEHNNENFKGKSDDASNLVPEEDYSTHQMHKTLENEHIQREESKEESKDESGYDSDDWYTPPDIRRQREEAEGIYITFMNLPNY